MPAVSWPWVPAWGLLEPPRRDGENAQKTRKNGEKMGEIRPKTCEGRELTKDQLADFCADAAAMETPASEEDIVLFLVRSQHSPSRQNKLRWCFGPHLKRGVVSAGGAHACGSAPGPAPDPVPQVSAEQTHVRLVHHLPLGRYLPPTPGTPPPETVASVCADGGGLGRCRLCSTRPR